MKRIISMLLLLLFLFGLSACKRSVKIQELTTEEFQSQINELTSQSEELNTESQNDGVESSKGLGMLEEVCTTKLKNQEIRNDIVGKENISQTTTIAPPKAPEIETTVTTTIKNRGKELLDELSVYAASKGAIFDPSNDTTAVYNLEYRVNEYDIALNNGKAVIDRHFSFAVSQNKVLYYNFRTMGGDFVDGIEMNFDYRDK